MLPHIKHDIPIFILMRAFGIESDADIIEYLCQDFKIEKYKNLVCILKDSLIEGSHIRTQEQVLKYLMKYATYYQSNGENTEKNLAYLKNIFDKEFLPHITQGMHNKILFTGYMTSRLLKVFCGELKHDDRDSYENKRIDTAGRLMANLYKMLLNKLVKDLKQSMAKEFNNGSWRATGNFNMIINNTNIYKLFKTSSILQQGFRYALATGNWGAQKVSKKQGIAQVLQRLGPFSTLSHLRRVVTPMEKNGKLVAPRKLHPSQIFVMCPAETPEGQAVGIVKNLALSAQITNKSNPDIVKFI